MRNTTLEAARPRKTGGAPSITLKAENSIPSAVWERAQRTLETDSIFCERIWKSKEQELLVPGTDTEYKITRKESEFKVVEA